MRGQVAGLDSGSELSIFCLRAVDTSKMSFISSRFSEWLGFTFCMCLPVAVWLPVAFWPREDAVLQLSRGVISQISFLWLSLSTSRFGRHMRQQISIYTQKFQMFQILARTFLCLGDCRSRIQLCRRITVPVNIELTEYFMKSIVTSE